MFKEIRRRFFNKSDKQDYKARHRPLDLEQLKQRFMEADHTQFLVLPADETVVVKPASVPKQVFERLRYCVFCGNDLEEFADIKECPYGCGTAYPTEDMYGMPGVMFATTMPAGIDPPTEE